MIRNYFPRYYRQALFTKGNIEKAIARAEEVRSNAIAEAETFQQQAEKFRSGGPEAASLVKAYENHSLNAWMKAAKAEKDIQKLEDALELKKNDNYQKGTWDYFVAIMASYLVGYIITTVRNHLD